MTNCCNANGNCTQGRDCPIRKQRTKAVNDAYINMPTKVRAHEADDDNEPSTVKALIAWVVVVAFVGIAFKMWVNA